MSNLYNRNLLSKFEATDIANLLDQAIICLSQGIELIRQELQDALKSRLELRKAILLATRTGSSPWELGQADFWVRCTELLPSLIKTKEYGVPVKQSFSAKLQRRLASSVPPRPIVDISFEDAYAHLTRLCQNSKEAYGALNYHGGTNLMVRNSNYFTEYQLTECSKTFVWSFQSRAPSPSVYVRCLLQSLIESETTVLGKFSLEQFVVDDLEEIVLPANWLLDPANSDIEAPHDQRFQVAYKIRAFVLRAGEVNHALP